MLKSLQIKNLALVQELEIEFSDGLNVVTGETGAGKSVILGAIKLLLGERADKSLIRTNAKAAEISAVLELAGKPHLQKSANRILTEAGILTDENGQVILRRIVTPGSSRSFINSTPVTLNVLKELGTSFIDMYTPGQQQRLVDNSRQRLLLDRYTDMKGDVEKTACLYKKWQSLLQQKQAFHREVPDRGELEILRYQLQEINQADIKDGEDIAVSSEYNKCAGAKELLELSRSSMDLLSGEESSVLNMLQMAVRKLEPMARLDGEETSSFTQRVEAMMEEVYELTRDLDNYASRLNLDPESLAFLEERMSLLQQMKKKFGPEIEDIFTYRDKLTEKITKADSYDELYQKLLSDIQKSEKEFLVACEKLSQRRKKAGKELSKSISQQLQDLDFNDSYFEIQVERSSPGPHGFDHIEFCFAPNKGEGAKPMKDIASSGEISRVMLAVKTVLAKVDQVSLLIFDEIDANIGGIVATKVANKLVELGKEHQIFCITHMPQVAACGKTHFRVEKYLREGRTFTKMNLLGSKERVEEIARMLGGSNISSVVKNHAEELLNSC